MTTICDLIEWQGINLGGRHKSNVACLTFVDFIAKELRLKISMTLQSCKFFSIQMDGSTDATAINKKLMITHVL